ncbi:MAG: hypothetical protein AUI14_04105 [Actinobacteria bacterium 13_2_20CM_2_71_6]|nr:MAG: hypothetical protein AUI14_04105 [Actinobacteria bacterium 13_2_20CM_2_71_6]
MTGPVRHPAWCDPSRCDVTAEQPAGTHCSRPVVLGPHPPSTLTAEVSLAQSPEVAGYPWSGRPYVALALSDADGELCLVPLVVELARGLGRVLIGFSRGADR